MLHFLTDESVNVAQQQYVNFYLLLWVKQNRWIMLFSLNLLCLDIAHIFHFLCFLSIRLYFLNSNYFTHGDVIIKASLSHKQVAKVII